MKRFLPRSKSSAISHQLSDNHKKGFTLIELLVVVSIIAILAVIGMVMLGGLQGRARDTQRRAEVDAILKAYEINYDADTGQYPVSVADEDFADGEIPVPPEGGTYSQVVTPTTRASVTVCAALEGGTAGCNVSSDDCYCKSGAQGSTGSFSQTCTTNFPQNCRASVSSGSVPSNAYIACPSTALNCSVSGSTAIMTGVQYWTIVSGGTPAAGTMSIYPISGNSFSPVTINKHQ